MLESSGNLSKVKSTILSYRGLGSTLHSVAAYISCLLESFLCSKAYKRWAVSSNIDCTIDRLTFLYTHTQMLKGPSLSEEEQAFLEDNMPAAFADIPLSDFLPLPQTKSYHAVNEVETLRLQSADFREVSVRCACMRGLPTCLRHVCL